MMLLLGRYMHTVICLILVSLQGTIYLASADTDEYQAIRVLAERYVLRKYEGRSKGMLVQMGGTNDGDDNQRRKIRLHPDAIEAGISMVRNLEHFLVRQDPRVFEKPEILSSFLQECDEKEKVAEEDRGWDDDVPDYFCNLKDSAKKFLKEANSNDFSDALELYGRILSGIPGDEPMIKEDEFESILRGAKCGIYLAPSTIPNSGNGMFTGVNVALGTRLEKIPFFMMSDMNFKPGMKSDDGGMMNSGSAIDYYWDARLTETEFKKSLTENHKLFIGGFGSLANFHPGLVNVERKASRTFKPVFDGKKDPGAGAVTNFEDSTIAGKSLAAGRELFISYGNGWMNNRSEYDMLPRGDNYRYVDTIISYLLGILSIRDNFDYFKMLLFLFRSLPGIIKRSAHILQTVETVEDIENLIVEGGAAAVEMKASYSLEWLEKNGQCLDHIYSRLSDIPSAGRGAFSRRFIKKDEVVITSPLMAYPKNMLEEFYDETNKIVPPPDFESRQLILNYCFSHPKSSLALFPLTQSILINHASARKGSDKLPNTKIRWATGHAETQHLLHSSPDLVLEIKAAKPFLEFVATRDIELDEEVLIDYGEAWEDAWNSHLTDWSLQQSLENQETSSASILEMNRNKFDASNFWSNVHLTFCDRGTIYNETLAGNAREFHDFDKNNDKELIYFDNIESSFIPCKIQGTNREKETFDVVYYYDINHEVLSKSGKRTERELKILSSQYFILKDLPAEHLQFSEKHSHERRAESFRHEIMIPDDIFPESWKDL